MVGRIAVDHHFVIADEHGLDVAAFEVGRVHDLLGERIGRAGRHFVCHPKRIAADGPGDLALVDFFDERLRRDDLVGRACQDDLVVLEVDGDLHRGEARFLGNGLPASAAEATGVVAAAGEPPCAPRVHTRDVGFDLGVFIRQEFAQSVGRSTRPHVLALVRHLVRLIALLLFDEGHDVFDVLGFVADDELVRAERHDFAEDADELLGLRDNCFRDDRLERDHDLDDFRVAALLEFLERDLVQQFRRDLCFGRVDQERVLAPDDDPILLGQHLVEQVEQFRKRVFLVRPRRFQRERAGRLLGAEEDQLGLFGEPVEDLAPVRPLEGHGVGLLGFGRHSRNHRHRHRHRRDGFGWIDWDRLILGGNRAGEADGEHGGQPTAKRSPRRSRMTGLCPLRIHTDPP